GSYEHYSRHALVKRAALFDFIFAVSDITREEFLFLEPKTDPKKIKVVYNGLSIETVPYERKLKAIDGIREYCRRLFNFRPDFILTHVTRLVRSKAIWRDIRFLYHLDEQMERMGKTGFYLILSTLVGGGRHPDLIQRMETEYGWPVLHREGWPDLVGPESEIYHQLLLFNARSRALKGVFVNQFGFDTNSCGQRLPKNVDLTDLRLASDVEFGLSIYEPFGIAQLETLPFGGLPLITTTCGCAGLLKETMKPHDYLAVDFTTIPKEFQDQFQTNRDFKKISKELRDQIETVLCASNAITVANELPKTDKERKNRFQSLQKRSSVLDWEHVAKKIADILSPST
ncbi:MAG: hypothetical protein Q7S00_01085, partial [bacterium]|nr:hypothetical protein [bacterium]